jgi:hypothetical protein
VVPEVRSVEATGGFSTYDEARPLVDEITHGLGGTPDLQTVEWERDGVWVMFPECDFRLLPAWWTTGSS